MDSPTTRAVAKAGLHPAPLPLYSPQAREGPATVGVEVTYNAHDERADSPSSSAADTNAILGDGDNRGTSGVDFFGNPVYAERTLSNVGVTNNSALSLHPEMLGALSREQLEALVMHYHALSIEQAQIAADLPDDHMSLIDFDSELEIPAVVGTPAMRRATVNQVADEANLVQFNASLKSPSAKSRVEETKQAVSVDKRTANESPAKPAAKAEVSKSSARVKGETLAVSDREAIPARESTSGLVTKADFLSLIDDWIYELTLRQRVENGSAVATASPRHKVNVSSASGVREAPTKRESTPGRLAAEHFFDKALRGSSVPSVKTKPVPSDPSDDSSSLDTGASPSEAGHGGLGTLRRSTSGPRLPSKRSRGKARQQKMRLKPIPPSRYNGEPNANAIQRFARESVTYVAMGHVPEENHVYFVSYYLDGKALDFYNRIVVPTEDEWTLKKFFVELFNFCFPVDFRNKQRKRLDKLYQGARDVAEHVAEWSEIYNTIGLEDTQEKIVKLFNSLTHPIQTEIYRKGLDPEVATWDEIVDAALKAEILVKIDEKNRGAGDIDYDDEYDDTSHENANEPTDGEHDEDEYGEDCDDDDEFGEDEYEEDNEGADVDADELDGEEYGEDDDQLDDDVEDDDEHEDHGTSQRGGRVEGPQVRSGTTRATVAPSEYPRSNIDRDEYMRKGLCFNCGGRGHRARDCPSPRSGGHQNEGNLTTHAAYIHQRLADPDNVLYETTEMAHGMFVGSLRLDLPVEVEEGEVVPMEIFEDFFNDIGAKNVDFDDKILTLAAEGVNTNNLKQNSLVGTVTCIPSEGKKFLSTSGALDALEARDDGRKSGDGDDGLVQPLDPFTVLAPNTAEPLFVVAADTHKYPYRRIDDAKVQDRR